jgi:hypothetical protein
MKIILFTLALLTPVAVSAQPLNPWAPNYQVPQYGVSVAPIVPVVPVVPPANLPRNPYGTGYSIVTTEKTQPDYIQQYLGNRDATTHTTTTQVVPNNAWGQPIRPLNLWP